MKKLISKILGFFKRNRVKRKEIKFSKPLTSLAKHQAIERFNREKPKTGKPKFIIENGVLVFGWVNYHSELAKDPKKVSGGGWFLHKDDHVILYGSSTEFGTVTEAELKTVFLGFDLVKNYTGLDFGLAADGADTPKTIYFDSLALMPATMIGAKQPEKRIKVN